MRSYIAIEQGSVKLFNKLYRERYISFNDDMTGCR